MEEEEVKKYEKICEVIYNSQDKNLRLQAESHLAIFQTIEGISKIQALFTKSRHPYTLFYASTQITKLFTDNWNSFSKKQKIDQRNFLINYIGQYGSKVPNAVTVQILKLLSRITKLGWLEDQDNRDLPEQIKKYFVQSSNLELCVLGLDLLDEMITEMNTITAKQNTSLQRKISISFRDVALRSIFESSLFTIKEIIRSNNPNEKVCQSALKLALNCLKYDFVGIYPDEANDDITTIQVPSSWRPLFEESDTVQLMWNIFNALKSSESKERILEILVYLSCVRRSLFTGDEEREAYLVKFLEGMEIVLENRRNLLTHGGCFHQFCRLLTRLKSNFQLKEFVSCKNYPKFIELCAQFSVESFKNPETSTHCIYYLLNLWSRLVASQPYLGSEKDSSLDKLIPVILKEYVTSRITMVPFIKQNGDDNPLYEAERLDELLDSIPTLFHSDYEKLTPIFKQLFDPIFENFQESLKTQNIQKLQIAEEQLTWIFYMYGTVIGKRSCSSNNDEMEIIDGEMTGRIFRCANIISQLIKSNPISVQDPSLQQLEISTLVFMKEFKQLYLSDNIVTFTKIYEILKNIIDISDQSSLLNLFINKISTNLKIWAKSEKIITETMDLFSEISLGYSSAKLVSKLESIKGMISNHSIQNFQFLAETCNMHSRVVFYNVLTKLLFADEYTEQTFLNYMNSIEKVFDPLEKIQSIEQFRTTDVKIVLSGLFRDLRGICNSCTSKQKYQFFFEWLFHSHMPLLIKTAQALSDIPEVMNSLLKFMSEFVFNRTQRIEFESSSPNGILLFKETSKLLTIYGQRMEKSQVNKDAYKEKYKGIMLSLQVLTRSLEGNYCCFGVFEIYKDRSLIDVLLIITKLTLMIPIKEIMSFPKLCKSYFTFLDVLFNSHTETAISFDSQTFLQLVISFEEGIKSDEVALSSQICATLDRLLTFYYNRVKKKDKSAQILQKHFSCNPKLLPKILTQLFNTILFEECQNQWSVSRTIMSLIVTNPTFFEELKKQIINSMNVQEKQTKMNEAFQKLMNNVEMNLEELNKDKFTGNLITFKEETRGFI